MARKTKQPTIVKTTVEAAIADAFAELETLGEELRGWADNTPEGLQGSSKYEEVCEAADALEGLSQPDDSDIPEEVKALEVTYQRATKTSRAARRNEATSMLSGAAEVLRAAHDTYDPKTVDICPSDLKPGQDEDAALEEAKQEAEDAQAAIDTLADEVEELQQAADDVQFPGMY